MLLKPFLENVWKGEKCLHCLVFKKKETVIAVRRIIIRTNITGRVKTYGIEYACVRYTNNIRTRIVYVRNKIVKTGGGGGVGRRKKKSFV